MRILIAEDSVLLRAGLIRLLEEGGHTIVGEVGDADSLVTAAAELEPDLAVIDVRMPPTHTDDGLRAALSIRGTHPDIAILVLSQYVEATYASELLAGDIGRVGYLLKDRIADVQDFLDAVKTLGAGGTVLDPEVVSQIFARSRRTDPLTALSPREREVLALMAEGRSNSAIAAALVVGDGAIEKHVTSIFSKLGLPPADSDHRRVLAVLRWMGA